MSCPPNFLFFPSYQLSYKHHSLETELELSEIIQGFKRIHEIIPSEDYNYWLKHLDTQLNNSQSKLNKSAQNFLASQQI